MNKIIDRFKYAIEKNRLSHLYLFSGSLGVTKTHLAKDIAYLILKNHNDYPTLRQQLDHLNHPNLVYIAKEGQTIKKEQVMNLQAEFSKTSLVDGPRIFIIEQAETMSNQAANSLLKFLEEPKDAETIGFLLVDDINQILPTIQSRSQIIRLTDAPSDVFVELLMNQEIDEKNAHFLSNLTKEITEAIGLFSDQKYMEAVDYIDQFIAWLNTPKTDLSPIFLNMGHTFYQDKDYVIFILDILCQIFLDLLHLHMNQKVQYEFMKEDLLEFVKYIDSNTAQNIIIRLQKTIKNLRLPINTGLALSALALDIQRFIHHG